MENVLIKSVPVLLALLRQAMEFVAIERARSGKTAEEVFSDADVRLDSNQAALLADLEKYN